MIQRVIIRVSAPTLSRTNPVCLEMYVSQAWLRHLQLRTDFLSVYSSSVNVLWFEIAVIDIDIYLYICKISSCTIGILISHYLLE
jgi:hypothetical protein